jgi:hypothetical protein
MKYYVIPESLDGCTQPTTPEPIPLEVVSSHITVWLDRFHLQGYFSNCRQERIPLNELSFRVVPETLA